MATITRFEDLEAWKKARGLAGQLFKISRYPKISRDFALINQIRRAAISVMSNIAEGFARRTDKEFVSFLSIAHGSVAECQSLLYVLLDEQIITAEVFKEAYEGGDEVSRLIQGLANYLKRPR